MFLYGSVDLSTHEVYLGLRFSQPEVREATKHIAETQDPSSQDPGDHNVQPFKHNFSPVRCEANTDNAGSQRSGNKSKTNKSTKQKPGKTHIVAMDKSALCELKQLMCYRLSLACIETNRNQKNHNCKAPGKGAKRSSTRCGNPESPQPGSRRSQRDAHRAQQAPQSQDSYHALHERDIGPAAGTLPWWDGLSLHQCLDLLKGNFGSRHFVGILLQEE